MADGSKYLSQIPFPVRHPPVRYSSRLKVVPFVLSSRFLLLATDCVITEHASLSRDDPQNQQSLPGEERA